MNLPELKLSLSHESIRSLLINGLLLLVLLPLPIRYDNIQLFIVSFAMFLLAILMTLRGDVLIKSKTSIALCLFIGFCLVSNLFALNISLTWYPFFTKVSFISFILLISTRVVKDDMRTISIYSVLGSIIFVLLSICTFLFGEAPHSCKHCFSHIGNYICGVGLLLVPFAYFNNILSNKLNAILSGSLFLTVFSLSVISGARGVLLVFVALIFLYLLLEKKFKYLLTIILFSSLSFLACYILFDLALVAEFGKRFELSRYYNQLVALDIFSSFPFFGCGLGNWSLAFNSLSLDKYNDFYLYYNHLMNIDNHNQLTDLFAEVGIGALLFYGSIFFIIVKSIKEYQSLVSIEKAALLTSCCFILLSLFYRSVNSEIYFFSKSQYIFALAIGLLLKRQTLLRGSKYYNSIIIFGLLLSSIWFVYWNLKDRNLNNNLSSSIILEQKLSETDRIYNSLFYTHNSKRQSLKSVNAELCLTSGDSLSSISYFKEALSDRPNDPNILLKLAVLTLRNRDFNSAEIYSLQLLDIEEDYVEPNLLLIEIYCDYNQNFDQAEFYLKRITNSTFPKPYRPYINYWRAEIDRKRKDLDLNEAQRISRVELRNLLIANEFKRYRSYKDYSVALKKSKLYLKSFNK